MRGFPALLIGIVMVGAVIGLRAPSPSVSASPSSATPGASTAVVATPVAPAAVPNRPGEPMLVPGQATDLRRAANGHFFADARINGQPVTMLVDTGATTVALTVDDARRLGLAIDPDQFQVVGAGVSGPARGQIVMLNDVAVGDHHAGPIQAVVVEGLAESLLGQSYLSRVQMQVNGDTMTLR